MTAMEKFPNETNIIDRIEEELPKSTLYWFFLSLAVAVGWTIYLVCYNSRVNGLILSRILNRFIKYGHINIGSFSISVLSGKIMFRAVHFITEDFSIRIEYGFIIFRWWRPYVYRELGEDMSHADARVYSFIDQFEFHVYNRSDTYDRLKTLFGVDLPSDESPKPAPDPEDSDQNKEERVDSSKKSFHWRDLIPVFKFDIQVCKFVFGNNLVPSALIVRLDESHVTYTTTPPSTPFDQFMHDVKVKTENLRIMFVPSDRYEGDVVDEAPRMMGEGFVLMQSTDVKLHFYMDEPGVVPYEPEMVELADGETVVKRTYPCFGMDVQCGKNTDFNYGPWADRQREYLWKFFYPSDYQPLQPTEIAEAGQRRQYKTFEFRMNIVTDSTIDILYTKNSVTQAIHMNMGQGSYVEASMPWVTEETGYTSVIKGQLLLLEATTSMQFRSLLECETLDFSVQVAYPIQWNEHQDWKCSFTACKATLYLIFQHKFFFGDLMEDWSSKSVPDVFHFVPYTYNINILINQFELVTLCNEYNWIDTSSQQPENAHIAFCGEVFDLSLQLPYHDFLPTTNSLSLIFKVETVFCRIYLPENNTSRHVVIALSENMKIVDRDGNLLDKPFCHNFDKQWRRLTERSAGWVDCWMTSNVALTVTYTYHPMPPLMKTDSHHVTPPVIDDYMGTPDIEEALLIPLRPVRISSASSKIPEDFDAAVLDSDMISVELEVAPSVLCLYGSLLRNFLHVKENYFGEDQNYTDFYDSPTSSVPAKEPDGILGPLTEKEVVRKEFDERKYRPFGVTISLTLHDIQGHLMKNCNEDNVPCPSVYVERLGFEMDKRYEETKLQVLLSPAVLIVRDNVEREADQTHLHEGHVGLSGLQIRGHAMFSHEGLPLESETLEYAWLVEAIIGDITGKLTSPQLQNIVEFVQTFIMLVEDPENSLLRPLTYKLCQHCVPQPQCNLSPKYPFSCPSSDDIKYKMTRASVDSINIFLCEAGSALNIQIFPVRVSTCNLHGNNTSAGITALLQHISLKQYISTAPIRHDPNQMEIWLESGGLSLGPINAEAAIALPAPDFHEIQDQFLKRHDTKTCRLWFLWPGDGARLSSIVLGKCGCIGGCKFFGNNKNGVDFFHPKKSWDLTSSAVLKITPDGMDPGFGQSLLHKNKLVFEISSCGDWLSPSKEFSFTRGYMSNLASPETPMTSITVVEECISQVSSSGTDITNGASFSLTRQQTVSQSPSLEHRSLSSTTGHSEVPSTEVTNPFDIPIRGSDSSHTPSLSASEGRSSGTEKQYSVEEGRGGKSRQSLSSSQQSSPPFSPATVHSGTSRTSLQSPESWRGCVGDDPPRQQSTVSLESEMYFSAEEDSKSSSDQNDQIGSSLIDMELSRDSTSLNRSTNSSRSANDTTLMQTVLKPGSSSSESTLSYMSADTEQDLNDTLSAGMPEDLSMVDLHGQVNKPITKSPVLLPCYANHLTKLQCNDWAAPAPFPSKYMGGGSGVTSDPSYHSLSSASQSVHYIHSPACLPHFIKLKQGFSTRIMKTKAEMFRHDSTSEQSDSWSKDNDPFKTETSEVDETQHACRTTATVRLKGSVDILLTPLLLESFQRLAEAVTPTLTSLHPSSILDGLHSRCLDRLKSQNRLKKSQNSEDPETPETVDPPDDINNGEASQKQLGAETRNKSTEIKTSSYQALVTLSKINICVLQAGMVEELISFSALDNISELTCVSLLGVCIDNIRCQLLSNSHSCKTTVDVLPNLLNGSPTVNKTRTDAQAQTDLDKDDIPEILREEDVGTVHIAKIHLQLRRLLKDSNYSEEVILTAVPEQKSRVMFTFDNDVTKLHSPMSPRTGRVKRSSSSRSSRPSMSRQSSKEPADDKRQFRFSRTEDNPFDAAPQPKLLRQKSRDRPDEKTTIGFIMFECGLEDISISAVRRLGYKDQADDVFHQRMESVEKNAENMATAARQDVEGPSGQDVRSADVRPGTFTDNQDTDSVHSWDSRISLQSESIGSLNDPEPLRGDASSGTLHLNIVWFNFAAPPPLPIKRKADFTRYDWNLLSTATPAINAWMTPLDRMMSSFKTLAQELTHRTNSVMACIMTEGLEILGIHMPYKSKYLRITNFSKTLQEDASCQLLTVLRRYIHREGTGRVELAVLSETIPQLITIQKGILALTRQWKNVLYMPQLSQLNFKSRKHRPYTVSFAQQQVNVDDEEEDEEEDDAVSVNYDFVDERASLLDGRSGRPTESVQSLNRQTSGPAASFDPPIPNIEVSSTTSAGNIPKMKRIPHRSRAATPISGNVFDSPEKLPTNPHMTSLLRNESIYSFQSASGVSVDPHVAPTPPTTPYRVDLQRQEVLKSKVDADGDLYRWMAQQQEGFGVHPSLDDEPGTVRRQDSFLEAFGKGLDNQDSHTDVNMEHFTMGTSIMQLADAQNLFKPFLQSIGLHVESVRPTAMMKNFGGNLSLQAKLDVLKIQIADSVRTKTKGKGKGKSRKYPKLIDSNKDIPSFLCQVFSVNVSMRDVVDFEKKESDGDKFQNFKFAMHKLEAKPATLQVNFMIGCQSVTQHVDMPLLRLIHQFVTVVENFNETRMELKQSHSSVDWIRTHRKQDSKGSTSSADTHISDVSRSEKANVKTTEAHSSNTNLATESKGLRDSKGSTRHKPSLTSFNFPFGTIRPERLSFPASLKKSHLRFSKDSKKQKQDMKSPGHHAEVLTPPQSLNLSDSVNMEMNDTSSPALAEKTIVDEISESTPKCWRTLYHLLELYSTMPETKTVGHRPVRKILPVIEEEATEKGDTSTPSDSSKTRVDLAVEEEAGIGGSTGGYENTPLARSTFSRTRFKQSIYIGDSVPLVVFGIAKIDTVKILAVLSGLKLEAELQNVHSSGTYKEKVKGFLQRKSSESSVTAHIGHTMIVLLEGPSLQTVVTVNIAKSQGLHTTVMRRGKGHNSAMVSIGEIVVDIPQHPVVLHGMMTRGTRQLSTTLQEFRRPIYRTRGGTDMPDYGTLDSKGSGQETSSVHKPQRFEPSKPATIHIHVKAIIQGITIGASLLPSLKAQHKTGPITITGVTVKKARFTVDLPKHTLSFKSKMGLPSMKVTTLETAIPSSASIDLPPIHVYADYRKYGANASISEPLTEGLMLKEGNYLNAVAEVGMFEHSLTTDLLNHLVFVQKVFMKEVNELLQKVSGSDKPVPLWPDNKDRSASKSNKDQMLYSFHFRLKGIQITATTPTNSAVRLETEAIDLEISNRVQMANQEAYPNFAFQDSQKVFVKAHVDLNVALGQLLKNPLFEEADPEFQTMAFFKTKIGIRNALQDEMIPGVSTDQEALLITLTRPIILAQPMAFDKAVLVWLNYKNAYDYWTEQRLALNKEIQSATQQVINRLPQLTSTTQQALSTLFLQLTVDDIGICLPVANFITVGAPAPTRLGDTDPVSAVVMTIESTQIAACSSGSLVSKGKFTDFCLRIADDFETSLDDWKPKPDEVPVMNACVVPEGTYEVCSRTINKQTAGPNSNAKWILNVKWEMQGIDVHLDTNIGKRLSAIGNTLTSLTAEVDEDYMDDPLDGRLDVSLEDISDAPTLKNPEFQRRPSMMVDNLPKFVYDTSMDPKLRARLIEKEMNEQAKLVQDLQDLGASQATIESEIRKLEDLKTIIFHDFKREVINKLKKQGERASGIKDTLGIGSKPTHVRTRSYAGGVTVDRNKDRPESLQSPSGKSTGSFEHRHLEDVAEITSTKVQFGETLSATYTPPETPNSTPQHTTLRPPDRRAKTLSLPVTVPSHIAGQLLHSDVSSSSSSSSLTRSDDSSAENSNPVFKTDSSTNVTMRNSHMSDKTTSSASLGSQGSKTMVEPNVDFELDVKVRIDSGQCVLHPKDSKEDENKRNKRERTPTSEAAQSPPSKRKMKKQESANLQAGGTSKKQPQDKPVIENTVFFLPGVDVKVHYKSKTDSSNSPSNTLGEADATFKLDEISETLVDKDSSTFSVSSLKRPGVKKASLYAWLSLQSLPEEMIISPCLLDFLEQALEPIPMFQGGPQHKKETVMDSVLNMDLNASYTSIGTPTLLGSFPVDVVVFIRVEPSIIRFNCQPMSRVECLLQVPSLELVFSTKRADIESNLNIGDNTPPTKPKVSKNLGSRERNPSGGLAGRESRTRSASTTSDAASTSSPSGGLSMTGCLSDFSLYIFHPYGAGKRKAGLPTQTSTRYLGSIQEQSVLSDITRKDSLSLNVEFVKVNISRSRKLEIRNDRSSTEKLEQKSEAKSKSNVVRFSAVCDIGTAAFKYDMRRLTEILSFPKAWYRRNLARRLFLGDESGVLDEDYDSSASSTCSSVNSDTGVFSSVTKSYTSPTLNASTLMIGSLGHHRRGSSGDKIKIQISPDFKNELASRMNSGRSAGFSAPQSPTDVTMSQSDTPTSLMRRRSSLSRSNSQQQTRTQSVRSSVAKTQGWETLVLFAVKLSRLDLNVNMSNVMGNTVWTTTEIMSQGRISIDSTGHKHLKITAGLGGSQFESRGGVIGGNLDLQEITTVFETSEDPRLGKDPVHKASLSLYAFEGRVDYMGSSVLMARLSSMDLGLRDEWKIDKSSNTDAPLATKRSALLFAHGDLSWDRFHILISRSTTPDLVKIVSKLEEFIMQHFTSSKRALGAIGPIPPNIRARISSDKRKSGDEDSFMSELRHHRHWQKALEHIIGCHFTMLPLHLPKNGMILGGTLTLRGNNLSLACFHGINFRSKAWAIFTMDEPYICFATEAQKTEDKGTHVVQDLTFYVGHDVTQHLQGKHMAYVCKLSRGHSMPPTFTNVHEWFHYAFSTAEIKDLDVFPKMRRDGSESPSDHRKRKLTEYNHDTEVIFAMPSMQLQLRSTHHQEESEPQEEAPKPVVECTFVTEFEDHIYVAMDAEVILFLHDLVSSYIREKDKVNRTSNTAKASAKSPEADKKVVLTDPTSVLKQDWREYKCKTWHLEPTVRLLHWAGRQIDPVGVDYVLQKLGFSHARVTIPKWMQRGFMDPSDKILSMLVDQLILTLRETPETKEDAPKT